MLYADFLHSASAPLLILGLFLVFLLAGEGGYRYGRSHRPRIGEHTQHQILTLQGAILGLLGLLLGFTFAMAVSRFDTRKQLMMDEANAIGNASLRARLLPETERNKVATLLRQYLDVRLEITRAGPTSPSWEQLTGRMAQLQDKLWAQAVAANEKDRRAVATGLFIQSLNESFDVAGKRDTAIESHVPEGVLLLLFIAAILAIAVVGYGCGLGEGRTWFTMVALSVLVAVVVLIILDLDRPREGLIRLGERSLLDLKRSMERAKP
jgi:hypothetical protein